MRHLILLALLVGCDGGETVWTETTKTDEGALCVEGLADDSATVYIDAQVCLSSSCDRNASGSCTATLDGTTITVSSTFSWEEASGLGRLKSFSVVHKPGHPGWAPVAPYVVGLVELDEGPTMLSHILPGDKDPVVGDRLELKPTNIGGRVLPAFQRQDQGENA